MKKKLLSVICACLCLPAAALALGGCRGAGLARPDKDYAVLSNGGQAVQYGDYVYFVNGTESGFADESGDGNVWGKVDKGGIFRVKLKGGEKKAYSYDPTGANSFRAPAVGKTLAAPNLPGGVLNVYEKSPALFPVETVESKNYNEKEEEREDITVIDPASVERVAPQIVRFSNAEAGGVYIFNDWLYYGSPSNNTSKTGKVEYNLTEFYRIRPDGTGRRKFYTSSDPVDAYMFYYYKGKVYLVCKEGSRLSSVDAERGRRTALEDDVGDVFLPRKTLWYKGIDENTAEDFIYYTRAVTKDDKAYTGNVLEMRRPDLKESEFGVLEANNATYSPAGADGNTLFYYETRSDGVKKLLARDLTGLFNMYLHGKSGEPAAAVKTVITDASAVSSQIYAFTSGGVAYKIGDDGKPYAAQIESEPYVVATENGVLKKYQSGVTPVSVADFTGTLMTVHKNTLYFTELGIPYSAELDWSGGAVTLKDKTQISKRAIYTENGLSVDIAGDMIFFIVTAIEQKDFAEHLVSGPGYYTYVKVKERADSQQDEFFLGVLKEKDIVDEDEE